MIVVFRCDSSVFLGGGHIMRCLTLANDLQKIGADISFICQDYPGNLSNLIVSSGYSLYFLPSDSPFDWSADAKKVQEILSQNEKPDWIIVDSYDLDARWESMMRAYTSKIMVIDDLANRSHDCDLLLDQNYYKGYEKRYDGLLPVGCKKLLGPEYVLLRQEFKDASKKRKLKTGEVRRVLVFFGSTDAANQTELVLNAFSELNDSNIHVDVVVGQTNLCRKEIESQCKLFPNFHYYCQVENMAELMLLADIAFGAGGATTWERCVLGLPTYTVVLAENQLQTTLDLSEIGVISYLGIAGSLNKKDYLEGLKEAINNPDDLIAMSENSMQLMNVNPCTDKCHAAINLLEITNH